MAKLITPENLIKIINGSDEFAIIDIRDYSDYLTGHLWLASRAPYPSLKARIQRLVPGYETRLILIDEDQSIGESAAEDLSEMGYKNVCILQGGMLHWKQSGYPIIEGDYVLAHSLGLQVEQVFGTTSITAIRLREKISCGENPLIVDTRDPSDFLNSSLPGSVNIPIADLIDQLPALVNNSDTEIILHCGGITRGIVGAQTLIDAGITNRIRWLEDGTSGWALAGGDLQPGDTNLSMATDYDKTADTGLRFAHKFSLTYSTVSELTNWKLQNPGYTAYLIDIRSKPKYQAGHYTGAINVPGGELIGMTIDHIATFNARIYILGTPHGSDADITAVWMSRGGWRNVVIIQDWYEDESRLNKGPEKPRHLAPPELQKSLSPVDKKQRNKTLRQSIRLRKQIFSKFCVDQPYKFYF